MTPRPLPLVAAIVLVSASPAWAQAQPVFKDVPVGYWAEPAVRNVAVDHPFMKPYPDGTFRGQEPFTRLQLAVAVGALIDELETLSKRSWATNGLGGYEFKDLPANADDRALVLKLANHYRLFEGVPGVTSETFETDKVVTRYEMAKVVDRLMHLGEAAGVVDSSVLKPMVYTFTDLPASAWDYDAVKEVSDHYQVMIGFPDGTFHGPEELTRYQFAAAAAQTFPLVHQLVEKTQAKQQAAAAAATAAPVMPTRFGETAPFSVHVNGAVPTQVGGGVRAIGYMGPVFGLLDANGAAGLAPAATNLYGGDLNVGWSFDWGSVHLQPYVGAGVLSNQTTLGGVNYGALLYGRPNANWGFYGRANGLSGLGATSGVGQGVFLGHALLGGEYYFSPSLGLNLELGYGNDLGLQPNTAAGQNAPITGVAGPTASLGLEF